MGTIKELSEENISESTLRITGIKEMLDNSVDSFKSRMPFVYLKNDVKLITNLNQRNEYDDCASSKSKYSKLSKNYFDYTAKSVKPQDLDSQSEKQASNYFLTNSDFKDNQSYKAGTGKLDKKNYGGRGTEEPKLGPGKSYSPNQLKSQ